MPGLIDMIRGGFGAMGGGAPAVPDDGMMQPTIGPGAAPPVAAPAAYQPKLGLPPGGILGMLQGKSPQGLMGLLQHLTGPKVGQPGMPLAGGMPQAGMMASSPLGLNPAAAPPAPVQLPTDINPMNQF